MTITKRTQTLSLHQAHQLVAQYYKKNDFRAAENILKQSLKFKPNEPVTLYKLAHIQLRQGLHSIALKNYTKAIQFDTSLRLSNSQQNLSHFLKKLVDLPTEALLAKQLYFSEYIRLSHTHIDLKEPIVFKSGMHKKLSVLTNILGFPSEFNHIWNTTVFENIIVPQLKYALQQQDYDFALYIEIQIYIQYVKSIENAAHFKACYEQFLSDMCEAGKEAAVSQNIPFCLPTHSPPKIIFFLHNPSLLAHTEVLLNMLEGWAKLDEKSFIPEIVVLYQKKQRFLDMFVELGISVKYLDDVTETPSALYQKLQYLKQYIYQQKIAAVVWVSLPTLMGFAYSMRIAPVQIWWAMKYDNIEVDAVDARLGLGRVRYKDIRGEQWRTIRIGKKDWFDPSKQREAEKIRSQYNNFDIVLGCFGRDEKLDNPEFIKLVATLLQQHPQAVFLWTGNKQRKTIQAIFDEYEVSHQCVFIGWVDTQLYAQVIDIFVDSFPYPCGLTLKQAMAAQKAVVHYHSDESLIRGLAGNITDILQVDSEENKQYLRDIFQLEAAQPLYFCATNSAEYFDYANKLITDKALRETSGQANKKYIDWFQQNPMTAVQDFSYHLENILKEQQEKQVTN